MTTQETREPEDPVNWPDGHVTVSPPHADAEEALRIDDVAVILTGEEDSECIRVNVGDYAHYLHSTTARELANKLAAYGGRPTLVTIHDVDHNLGGATTRTLTKWLQLTLAEWNKTAIRNGQLPV